MKVRLGMEEVWRIKDTMKGKPQHKSTTYTQNIKGADENLTLDVV